MRTKIGFMSSAILIILIACTSNSELVKEMTNSKKPLAAIDEKMGLTRQGDQATFRLFAPSQKQVNLILYENYDDVSGHNNAMEKKANGVWELSLELPAMVKYYEYELAFSQTKYVADPYSHAVVRQNNFRAPSKTVILPDEVFDWEGDDFTLTPLGDLVILEAHLRDMTVHKTSDTRQGGTYTGFIESGQTGGLNHLKDMGYNAVEFLPLQEFGNIEIDYKNHHEYLWNDWNPYENNHWGYMTSFFFAPETYYASDAVNRHGEWVGQDGRAVKEMKEMVKGLHKEGISVIMDVVYNHVSQYDNNPLKQIDSPYYFHLDEKNEFLGNSGCGNDFRTESPMARKLIVESVLYWMEAYHIDGFRFDLATMIDLGTVDAITKAARKLNPNVILIAEPWGGGGYNPAEFADHGWASWNDHFRNSIKGRNPKPDDTGFIFGRLWDGNKTEHYKNLMRGYPQSSGGHYQTPSQSVNYLESHDDNTLGDFIRLALKKVKPGEKVARQQVSKLSPEELKIHKFAALNLLVSQGPVMIAQGQSWGRAKVIANSIGTDEHAGQLDHNSYEKDDETNWLDWSEKALNKDLVDYYRGLIAIRTMHPALRNVDPDFRRFIDHKNTLSFGVMMEAEHKLLVLLNADPKAAVTYTLPAGEWSILANADRSDFVGDMKLEGIATVPPQSGLILSQQGNHEINN